MEYGIIGEHLKHSFSKTIHEDLGGYSYELREIAPENLADFLRKKEFRGINVTIPYKKDVIPFLDVIDESVKAIGACNVIVNRDGKLCGYNTDYLGMIAMIRHYGISLENRKVAILGTGGTSNTASYVARVLGAREILRVSRRSGSGNCTYGELQSEQNDIEAIINTTPSEMYPNNGNELLSLDGFPKLESVIDVVYNPLRTNLLLKAREKGLLAAEGLYMLIAQAVYGIELFRGVTLDKDIIPGYHQRMLQEKENIVLTGMPTSGKTSVGKLVAERLNRPFVDTDEEIVKETGMSISEYFRLHGEEEFRNRETEILRKFASGQGLVLATGGGAVLRKENIQALRQNGRIYFLDRSLDHLTVTDSRPLSRDREALKKRYEERYGIYRETADEIIPGDGTVAETAEIILGGYRK